MPCAVRAVGVLAKLLSEAPVESPEPIKEPPLRIFSRIICRSHSPPLHALTPTTHHTTMNYHDTAPADLSTFSLWPEAPTVSGEEMATWAQDAGYAEPGLVAENILFDDLDATLAWGQSGVIPSEPFDFQNNFVSTFTFET